MCFLADAEMGGRWGLVCSAKIECCWRVAGLAVVILVREPGSGRGVHFALFSGALALLFYGLALHGRYQNYRRATSDAQAFCSNQLRVAWPLSGDCEHCNELWKRVVGAFHGKMSKDRVRRALRVNDEDSGFVRHLQHMVWSLECFAGSVGQTRGRAASAGFELPCVVVVSLRDRGEHLLCLSVLL